MALFYVSKSKLTVSNVFSAQKNTAGDPEEGWKQGSFPLDSFVENVKNQADQPDQAVEEYHVVTCYVAFHKRIYSIFSFILLLFASGGPAHWAFLA
jgi:hypothetical protein